MSYRNIANNSLCYISFTEDEVSKCIDELSPGPDKFDVLFIKNCKSVLVGPLTNLFNISSYIPTEVLEESFINLVYKSEDAQNVVS